MLNRVKISFKPCFIAKILVKLNFAVAGLELLQDLTWRSFYPKEFHLEVAGALGPPCFDDLISVNKV